MASHVQDEAYSPTINPDVLSTFAAQILATLPVPEPDAALLADSLVLQSCLQFSSGLVLSRPCCEARNHADLGPRIQLGSLPIAPNATVVPARLATDRRAGWSGPRVTPGRVGRILEVVEKSSQQGGG